MLRITGARRRRSCAHRAFRLVAVAGPAPAYGLQYATNRGGNWTSRVLEDGYILSVAIAADGNDKVHVVYSNNVGELKCASDATGA